MKTSIITALAVGAAFFNGCSRGDHPVGGSGFIEATSVVISAETAGRLEALFVDEGDKVSASTPIGVIDSTTIKLQIDRALAQRQTVTAAIDIARITIEQTTEEIDLSRKEFDRVAVLIQKGSANQQQYDQAETRLAQAHLAKKHAEATHQARRSDLVRTDAEVSLLRRQLEDCYPSSPVSGIVVNKLAEPGELLAPGKPIVEVAKIDTVWVKVYLPAHDLPVARLGQGVSIDLEDGRNEPLPGEVVWISDEAEFTPKNVQTAEARADLVYAVKVNIANPQGLLKIGMPVMVRFPE